MTLDAELQRRIAELLLGHRWAALASTGKQGAECSWVALALEPGLRGFLLHLSDLASHTGNLRRDPRVSLAISEAECPGMDPQTLARLTFFGEALEISRDRPDYPAAVACYQARLPDAIALFEFTDFRLFRVIPHRARFIGGFAQAHHLDARALTELGSALGIN